MKLLSKVALAIAGIIVKPVISSIELFGVSFMGKRFFQTQNRLTLVTKHPR